MSERIVELTRRLIDRFRWCQEWSPEGNRCIYRRGHEGLHTPHMGPGWSWGTLAARPPEGGTDGS